MKIIIDEVYRISSTTHGGYKVDRKIGNQYKHPTFHGSLERAALQAFDLMNSSHSLDLIIDSSNRAKHRISMAKLIGSIELNAQRIVNALGGYDE